MKTLSGTLILVLSLYFAGCSTQTGGTSVSSAPSMSETSAHSTPEHSAPSASGGGEDMVDHTGPDVPDGEIAWGPHN